MSVIVGIGGTARPGSSTELALRLACRTAVAPSDRLEVFDGPYIAQLPFYRGPGWTPDSGKAMIDAIRRADGLIIASPGYHGSVSGMLKNALDYLENLAGDERVYLHDRPVGLIVTAFGHQAATSAMITLRTVVHALRGWPTPFGAALKVDPSIFGEDGQCSDPTIRGQLELVGSQLRSAVTRRLDALSVNP